MFSRFQCLVFSAAFALAGFGCKSSNPAPSNTPDTFSSSPGVAAEGAGAGSEPTSDTSHSSQAGAAEGAGAGAEPRPGPSPSSSNDARSTWSEGAPSAGSPQQSTTDAPEKQKQKQQAALSDAEIVAITAAANTAEIEQGQLARKKAKDARVRDFAAMMIDHHGDAKRGQQRLSVVPAPNDGTRRMQQEAQSALTDLDKKNGSEFDQAYLQLQIDGHRKVLEQLNDELLPAARSASLKAYLQEIKPQVESHLAQAERLQQELGARSQNGRAPGRDSQLSNR